jgi:transposase
MTDEAETMEPLACRAYDGPKSAVRARPDEDKLRMVRETLAAGAVVQVVADRNGVSTGQLYTWRKELLAAAVSGFVPVAVAPEVPRIEAPAQRADQLTAQGGSAVSAG